VRSWLAALPEAQGTLLGEWVEQYFYRAVEAVAATRCLAVETTRTRRGPAAQQCPPARASPIPTPFDPNLVLPLCSPFLLPRAIPTSQGGSPIPIPTDIPKPTSTA